MIEQPQVAERIANPELPSSAAYYAGLHPRLLMGKEALNPAKQDLPSITSDLLGNIAQRDYSSFTNASARERKAYWDQKGGATFEEKRQAWIKGCVDTFENNKTFFKDTDKGKAWSEFYAKLGIDTQNLTSQTVEALHTKYFLNQPDKLGIKQFVADMLNALSQDGTGNMAKVEANLAGISWLSKIFGNVSSEVITQMVMAEGKLLTNPEQLIQQANHKEAEDTPSRVNNLNGDEQRLLKFLWETPAQPTATLQTSTQPAATSPAAPETQNAQPTQADGTRVAAEALAAQTAQTETQATAVPAEISPLGRQALQEIRGLGLTVTADTNLSQLSQDLRNKGWNVDLPETQAYIEAAINIVEAETPRKLELEPAEGNILYLTAETKSSETRTIYLDSSIRGQLGVRPGVTITLVLNGEKQVVTVARPRVRDDGTIEGPKTNSLRVSADVLALLNLPKGYAALPLFNAATKEVTLSQPEASDSSVVKIRQPRSINYIPDTTGNTVFLSSNDLKRFGLNDGETITLHFGGVTREIIVNQRNQGEESWRISEQLGRELNFPGELPIRSTYDKSSRTLSFGPGIAVYRKLNNSSAENMPAAVSELNQRAKEYGAYVIIIDPNQQTAADTDAGFVYGLTYINGKYLTVRVPRPDILYEKGFVGLSQDGRKLTNSFAHQLVPRETGRVVDDKLHFYWILRNNGLIDYQPESLSLNAKPEEIIAFFDRHDDMIIKPQWGNSGRGVFRVTKQSDGFLIRERAWDRTIGRYAYKDTPVASVDSLLQTIPTLDSTKGQNNALATSFVQERIKFMEYEYDDPLTKQRLIGQVEPRIVVQRGVDGRIRIGGMVVRAHNDNSQVPHNLDLMWVLNNIYQNHEQKEEKVQSSIKELETTAANILQAVEQQSQSLHNGRRLGELTLDFGLTEDFQWKMIEGNPLAQTYDIFSEVPTPDAKEQRMSGAVEYSLHLTGMN